MFDTMPSVIRSSNEYLEPLVDMGYSLELKRNSRQQQTSKIVKERFPSPQARRTIKFQDKLVVENLIGQPYGDRHHGPRENVDDGVLIQPKYSENRQKQSVRRKAMKDDELVRHMSNLPGYLQRVDRGENVQEKALNVGVLNWEHLEKWKYSQKRIPARGSTNASSTSSNSLLFMPIGSSTISSTVQNETLAHQSKQKSLLRSNVNPSRKSGLSQGGKAPQGKVRCLQDFEIAPKGSLDWQKKIPRTERSSGRNYPEIMHAKGKRKDLVQKISSEMGTSSANLKNYGVSLSSKEKMSAHDGDTKKGIEELQESEINGKNFDQRITSEMGTSSSNLRNNGVSLRSKEKLCVWDGATEKRVEKLQESDINLAHQLFPGEHEDIVLLFPRNLPQNSFSDAFQLSETRTSLGENLSEANRKSFSCGFSPEVHSAEFYSEIPHSCPLPCGVETDTESDIRPHSLTDAVGVELLSDASHMFPSSKEMPVMQSEGKYPKGNKLDIKPMNSTIIESYKRLDLETAGLAATKGRNPSPNRRFSIGLGRMSKSLSFKEGSVVPQLSSTYVAIKSGPVSSEASACLDNSNRDKANATNRGRSSPLRRLLDPLLRPKAANMLHSAPETVWPLKGNLNSLSSMPINACESLQNEKHEVSTVHALLQFTIKNGVPLFKFVVNNNILAATVKNLSTSEKDDSSLDYTFYSVNEIKKKSTGWMNQASKEKSCDYAYNFAGQMKISSPRSPNLTGQNSKNQSMVRESVLFSVELRHAGQETPKFVPTRELAAIVVNIPSEDLSHDGEQSNKDEKLSEKGFTESWPEDRCSCNLGENKISCSTTVILPGGIHGLPNRGVPSPLLDRWRGGSCDCGGWDVGCKLCVLCNQDRCCKISGQSKACPIPDRFELFVQGGAQENRPFFSLVPFKKGIYSVEFKASISLLQAFFICVTVMSCRKSSDLSEMSNLFEARLLREPTLNGDDRSNTPTMVQGKVPAKYAPLPPLSPVGRV